MRLTFKLFFILQYAKKDAPAQEYLFIFLGYFFPVIFSHLTTVLILDSFKSGLLGIVIFFIFIF
ncbi:MAG TPA: hypothetical protein DEA46_04565 [Candidatus Moranbacteria bacterium]|nr:hypothetical protein [Candidatus Moranbacteria bacterium]